MKKYDIIILTIIFIVISGALYLLSMRKNVPEKDKFLEQIKRIENKIDSLSAKKDSIKTVILTVDRQIESNEKHYEKVINNVITQPFYLDSAEVTEYIDRFIKDEGYKYNLY